MTTSTGGAPLYLGFDLSTQQLKAVVIDSELLVKHTASVDFDTEFGVRYDVRKGVLEHRKHGIVEAPVAMWIESLDLILARLVKIGTPLSDVVGICGSGQQHGTVYWSGEGTRILQQLDPKRSLAEQLQHCFTRITSPNWQDSSTQKQCDEFDAVLGGPDMLAQVTGSSAHHRFSGPQILAFRERDLQAFSNTARISLVSSFLASLLIGCVAPIDISDCCGMNLWDIPGATWSENLLTLISGGGEAANNGLRWKLGSPLDLDPENCSVGRVHPYFQFKYGFKMPSVYTFTGDNPATILALPMREGDAMVSLGTSTTFLMCTRQYRPQPDCHFFNHPTMAGHYMFMLCYKNGGLAREQIRDELPRPAEGDVWANFNQAVLSTPIACQKSATDLAKIGLYYPLPEIVPNVRAGRWTVHVEPGPNMVHPAMNITPQEDARLIVESQMLSLRLRSRNLYSSIKDSLPQPRRMYVVGGGSINPAITKVIGEVLGPTEGVYRLDLGENACALGGAYKAVWASEKQDGEAFDDFLEKRWREEGKIRRLDSEYNSAAFEQYGKLLDAFSALENKVIDSESDPASFPGRNMPWTWTSAGLQNWESAI